MGVARAVPSLGAFTPLESMIKGGSSKVLNPMSLVEDTKTVLSKPSSFLNKQTLTGQGSGSAQTFTEQKKSADAANAESGRRAWYGAYGDAVKFNRDSNAIGASPAGTSGTGLTV